MQVLDGSPPGRPSATRVQHQGVEVLWLSLGKKEAVVETGTKQTRIWIWTKVEWMARDVTDKEIADELV